MYYRNVCIHKYTSGGAHSGRRSVEPYVAQREAAPMRAIEKLTFY